MSALLGSLRAAYAGPYRGPYMNAKTESAQAHIKGVVYSVCVRSILDEGWVRALDVEPIATRRHFSGPPRTILTVHLADQSEMLGLLNRLHNMNLTLLSVELNLPSESGDRAWFRWDDD